MKLSLFDWFTWEPLIAKQAMLVLVHCLRAACPDTANTLIHMVVWGGFLPRPPPHARSMCYLCVIYVKKIQVVMADSTQLFQTLLESEKWSLHLRASGSKVIAICYAWEPRIAQLSLFCCTWEPLIAKLSLFAMLESLWLQSYRYLLYLQASESKVIAICFTWEPLILKLSLFAILASLWL